VEICSHKESNYEHSEEENSSEHSENEDDDDDYDDDVTLFRSFLSRDTPTRRVRKWRESFL
jgi:hypothetical protein